MAMPSLLTGVTTRQRQPCRLKYTGEINEIFSSLWLNHCNKMDWGQKTVLKKVQ